MLKEITTQSKIRFADCDPIGHLNNVKYLEYMLNAREDHVEQQFGFSYEEYTRQTGCTWIAIQNEIAYLQELRFNTIVNISSSLIELKDRVSKVEIKMTSEDNKTTHAILWVSAIYFDMKSRKSLILPLETKTLFESCLQTLPESIFSDRNPILFLPFPTLTSRKELLLVALQRHSFESFL